MKTKNEELKINLDNRNKEFVDYKMGVRDSIYKDWDTQQHIESEVARVKGRYETIIHKHTLAIQELAEQNNKLKLQILTKTTDRESQVKL